MWAWERCRIGPPRFLAVCCKRQLNQGSFVLLYFRLSPFSDLYWVCLSVFSCTVLFVIISQVIGCEDRLRNYLYCVGWGVKLYSNQHVDTTSMRQGSFNGTVSVCLSQLSAALCHCGLLLCARRAGDMGRSRRAPQQHGVQQLMRAVSRCQLTYEAEHGLVLAAWRSS